MSEVKATFSHAFGSLAVSLLFIAVAVPTNPAVGSAFGGFFLTCSLITLGYAIYERLF